MFPFGLIWLLVFGIRVGLELPKIEVRFEDLSVEADAYAGSRALPTLLNATLNTIEVILPEFHLDFFFFFDGY